MSNPNAFPAPQVFPLLRLNDRTYDVLKWAAQTGIPSITTAYFLLGQLWGWPSFMSVVGTLVIIDTVLGIWLGLSTTAYNKQSAEGVFSIDTTDPKQAIFSMSIDGDVKELTGKRYVTLRQQ